MSTSQQQANNDKKTEAKLCTKCNSFWGSEAYQGMCSSCYTYSCLIISVKFTENLKKKRKKHKKLRNNKIKLSNIWVQIKDLNKTNLNVFNAIKKQVYQEYNANATMFSVTCIVCLKTTLVLMTIKLKAKIICLNKLKSWSIRKQNIMIHCDLCLHIFSINILIKQC